jgi:hypothetical protein
MGRCGQATLAATPSDLNNNGRAYFAPAVFFAHHNLALPGLKPRIAFADDKQFAATTHQLAVGVA